jgi:hypothetical protein
MRRDIHDRREGTLRASTEPAVLAGAAQDASQKYRASPLYKLFGPQDRKRMK